MVVVMVRRLAVAAMWATCLCVAAACTIDTAEEDDGAYGNDTIDRPIVATLEVDARDLWARPLGAGAKLRVLADGMELTVAAPLATIPLTRAATFSIELSAPDHGAMTVTVAFDGTTSLDAVSLTSPSSEGAHGVALAHQSATVAGGLPRHRVVLGLRHQWFSAQGRPPRAGNRVELFSAGDTAWGATHAELALATASVLASTWWWESDFELARDPESHPYLSDEQRRENTILGVLEASDAKKRVLVNQFLDQDGLLSGITMDAPLRAHGDDGGDDFEVMGQANPTSGAYFLQPEPVDFVARALATFEDGATWSFEAHEPVASNVPPRTVDLAEGTLGLDVPHASYHQKLVVIDDRVAYVGGMNLKGADWDTEAHAVFEPLRMSFDATFDERIAVAAREALPDFVPRKDYVVRIDGPSVADVHDVFARRWQLQLDAGVEYSEHATPLAPALAPAPHDDGVLAQLTATSPEPLAEQSVAESFFNALDRAEKFILIEDQFFRAPMMNDRILARMQAVPGLLLIVVTNPVNEWSDPGCAWTYQSLELFAANFPDRFLALALQSFDVAVDPSLVVIDETDAYFQPIFVHSKVLVVDDVFLSVGSANKNNRSLAYEGELNVAVLDAAWVRTERERIVRHLLGSGTKLELSAGGWSAQLAKAAVYNDGVRAAWQAEGDDLDLDGESLPKAYLPRGFLYSLPFGSLSDCLFESVGPDVAEAPPAPPP